MGILRKPVFPAAGRRREFPPGLWQKCPSCGEIIHTLELGENRQVCPKCGHHFPLGAMERVALLMDEGTFREMDADLASVDVLKFRGMATYEERLATYRAKTGMQDAVVTGVGRIEGREVALAVMDFRFLAATMGSVVGEKITRLIERATAERLPAVVVAASGGARMYEGMLSLMQMAKTSGALALHGRARLPYISVLTNPTTAGVMASFASLGDLILAEPRCMIGFAGPRVIRETTHQELPEGFQTAEFLRDRGLVDLIVDRRRMKPVLAQVLDYLCSGSPRAGGA